MKISFSFQNKNYYRPLEIGFAVEGLTSGVEALEPSEGATIGIADGD